MAPTHTLLIIGSPCYQTLSLKSRSYCAREGGGGDDGGRHHAGAHARHRLDLPSFLWRALASRSERAVAHAARSSALTCARASQRGRAGARRAPRAGTRAAVGGARLQRRQRVAFEGG